MYLSTQQRTHTNHREHDSSHLSFLGLRFTTFVESARARAVLDLQVPGHGSTHAEQQLVSMLCPCHAEMHGKKRKEQAKGSEA